MTDNEEKIERSRSKMIFTVISILEFIAILSAVIFDINYEYHMLGSFIFIGFKELIEIGATVLLVMICAYYLIKHEHPERISALFCLFISAYEIKVYATTVTYGDFIYFVIAFIIMLLSALQIAFSLDLFRGMKTSATILKIIMPMNILIILTLSIVEYALYNQIYQTAIEILWVFGVFQLTAGILAYISLFEDDVLKGYRFRFTELPRIQILASIMVLYGAIYLLNLQPALEGSSGFRTLANILFIIVGIIFLIYRNVDVLTSVSIMLFVIGLSTIFESVPDILSTNNVTMALGIITFLAGAICIVLCALMYSGDRFNTKRLQIIMLILLIASVVPIVLDARLHPDAEYLVTTQSNRFLTAALVAGTFIALTDRSIKYTSLKERMSFNVHTMNNTACNDANAYIPRTGLFELYLRSGWTCPGGPVIKEKTVQVFVNGAYYPFTVRKWSKDGRYTGEVHSSNDGTYIQAMRFDINKVIMDGTIDDCTALTVYGEKGFYIIIPVKDEEMEIETKKITSILYKIIGHKNKKVIKISFAEYSSRKQEDSEQIS